MCKGIVNTSKTMIRRIVVILTALVLSLGTVCGQQGHARADYDFGTYLIGNGLLRDAQTLARQPLNEKLFTPAALDTLHYLRGQTHYTLQNFGEATLSFGLVGTNSEFYPKSAFYGAVCHLSLGNKEEAKTTLDKFATTPQAEEYGELLAFERAGIALLEGDTDTYNTLQREFTYTHFALAEQQHLFDNLATQQPRNLSPWVAGLASAVVPGLGKIYAGNVGEGIASFLIVGAFAGLTAESWAKAGTPKNWRTITYGTIGGLLYIGNIFGSVASVRIYYEEFETSRSGAVMYGLHIPLRSIFR